MGYGYRIRFKIASTLRHWGPRLRPALEIEGVGWFVAMGPIIAFAIAYAWEQMFFGDLRLHHARRYLSSRDLVPDTITATTAWAAASFALVIVCLGILARSREDIRQTGGSKWPWIVIAFMTLLFCVAVWRAPMQFTKQMHLLHKPSLKLVSASLLVLSYVAALALSFVSGRFTSRVIRIRRMAGDVRRGVQPAEAGGGLAVLGGRTRVQVPRWKEDLFLTMRKVESCFYFGAVLLVLGMIAAYWASEVAINRIVAEPDMLAATVVARHQLRGFSIALSIILALAYVPTALEVRRAAFELAMLDDERRTWSDTKAWIAAQGLVFGLRRKVLHIAAIIGPTLAIGLQRVVDGLLQKWAL